MCSKHQSIGILFGSANPFAALADAQSYSPITQLLLKPRTPSNIINHQIAGFSNTSQVGNETALSLLRRDLKNISNKQTDDQFLNVILRATNWHQYCKYYSEKLKRQKIISDVIILNLHHETFIPKIDNITSTTRKNNRYKLSISAKIQSYLIELHVFFSTNANINIIIRSISIISSELRIITRPMLNIFKSAGGVFRYRCKLLGRNLTQQLQGNVFLILKELKSQFIKFQMLKGYSENENFARPANPQNAWTFQRKTRKRVKNSRHIRNRGHQSVHRASIGRYLPVRYGISIQASMPQC